MNTSLDQTVTANLQALCAANDAAKRLFTAFAQRQKDSRETTVDRAAWIAGIDYSSMLQLFRRLHEVGVGRFIPGRHGYSSRMEWNFSIRSLGKVAQGRARKLEEVAPDADTDETAAEAASKIAVHEHEFQLRSDLRIRLGLPADLTAKEAERLGAYLQTLPL